LKKEPKGLIMPMSEGEIQSYKEFWESAGSTYENALSMMDGSPDDRVLNLTGQYIAQRIARALLIHQNDNIFELGCGVGRIGLFIAPLCLKWHGFDISEKIIGYARERMKDFKNVNFQVLDKTELKGVSENYFDKGYSHAVFIHLDKEDLFLYLREVYRVLKPGGLFYFDTWNLANEVGWERWLWEVEAWAQSDQKERKHVSRNQFCVPQETKIYIEKAGFSEIFCLSESFWIQTLVWKPDGESKDKVESLRREIVPVLPRIGIPTTLSVLFKHHIDLLKGEIKPLGFYELLQQMKEDEEVLLYRNWLREVWKYKIQDWGTYPGKNS
jgi:ubiquinone/menaquinone biosynthesis C-methylase UbiE